MQKHICILILIITVFANCGQAKENNLDKNKTASKYIWKLMSIKAISKEHPDNIQLADDEIKKFKDVYFTFSGDTLIANDKYKAFITNNTIDARKFFGRTYLYNFYVDFFAENIHSDISEKLVYLSVSGIDKESITFFKFLNRVNYDAASPILANDQIIISYSGHIFIFGKFDTQNTCIKNGTLTLPLNRTFSDEEYTILQGNCILQGFDSWNCGEAFRYISLPSNGDIQVILVPMDCGDFPYRFYLLTVKYNQIISNLYVEGVWYEPGSSQENHVETTRFEISKDYMITVHTKQDGKSTKKQYKIDKDGNIK